MDCNLEPLTLLRESEVVGVVVLGYPKMRILSIFGRLTQGFEGFPVPPSGSEPTDQQGCGRDHAYFKPPFGSNSRRLYRHGSN